MAPSGDKKASCTPFKKGRSLTVALAFETSRVAPVVAGAVVAAAVVGAAVVTTVVGTVVVAAAVVDGKEVVAGTPVVVDGTVAASVTLAVVT